MPVAVDQHIHRHLKDDEGALFAAVLKQAGRGLGGYSQGVYIFDPAGNLLAFSNTADAGHVKRLMAKALASFQPAAAPKPDATPKSAPAGSPPEGTMIALVTSKVLGGYEKVEGRRTAIHAASLGQDHLWMRADEAAALAGGVLPESLAQRIVRYHLVDNTRGEPPFWRSDEVQSMKLALADGAITGTVELRSRDGARRYRAEVRGEVASEEGRLTRFDLVALGRFEGEGRYTRGAPPGEFPFAVAIRLVESRRAVDLVVPGAARGGIAGYLK